MLTAIHRRAPLIAIALAFTFIVAVTVGPAACRPNLGPVVNCRVGAYACIDGRPVVCSQSSRYEPAGDRICASVGAVCVVDDGGPAHCAPAVDASTDASEVAP